MEQRFKMEGGESVVQRDGDTITNTLIMNGEVIGKRILSYVRHCMIIERWYDAQGNLHRIGGPAVTFSDGEKILAKKYFTHGKLQDDGPCLPLCVRYVPGSSKWYKWYKN